jgi:integrase
MPTEKLSALFVKNAAPAPKGLRIEFWDSLLPAFGLRVSDHGRKSWVVMYRRISDGRQKRLTLGTYPAIELSKARAMARDILQQVAEGGDPAKAAKSGPGGTNPSSFEAVAQRYIERETIHLRRGKEIAQAIHRELMPAWASRSITEISRRDAEAIVDLAASRGTPHAAAALHQRIKRLFNWMVDEDYFQVSPMASMKLPRALRKVERDRVLSDTEIRRLWAAWDEIGWAFGPAFKLMLVTGQRRDEVAGMAWAEVHLDQALWVIGRERTKSDRLNEVPLSDLAVEIINSIPRMDDDLVFATRRGGNPISGFSKAKRRLDNLSGLQDWRIHDLRRTAATGMVRLGVPQLIVGKVLNHASRSLSGVTGIYDRHGYLDDKREALSAWSQHLREIVGPLPDSVTGP